MSEQPNRASPTVTVVVCNRGRPRLLENCLTALAQQTHPDFDVLVVDNAAAPQVRDLCRHRGARYVHEPVAGISRARNTGVRAAQSGIVAFIDDDAIADSRWQALRGAIAGLAIYLKARREWKNLGAAAVRSAKAVMAQPIRWPVLARPALPAGFRLRVQSFRLSQLMILRSHNEWGRLRSVVVGRADNARVPSDDLSLRAINYAGGRKHAIPHGPYPGHVIDEANEDLGPSAGYSPTRA